MSMWRNTCHCAAIINGDVEWLFSCQVEQGRNTVRASEVPELLYTEVTHL